MPAGTGDPDYELRLVRISKTTGVVEEIDTISREALHMIDVREHEWQPSPLTIIPDGMRLTRKPKPREIPDPPPEYDRWGFMSYSRAYIDSKGALSTSGGWSWAEAREQAIALVRAPKVRSVWIRPELHDGTLGDVLYAYGPDVVYPDAQVVDHDDV